MITTFDEALAFARDCARSDTPSIKSIGLKLLSIKKDEDLLTAVKLCELVLESKTPTPSPTRT